MYSSIFSAGFLFAALVCKLKRTFNKRNKIMDLGGTRGTVVLFPVKEEEKIDEIYHEM